MDHTKGVQRAFQVCTQETKKQPHVNLKPPYGWLYVAKSHSFIRTTAVLTNPRIVHPCLRQFSTNSASWRGLATAYMPTRLLPGCHEGQGRKACPVHMPVAHMALMRP